ncbi:MAG: hypothetical protein IAE80_15735 [Anaerolinea sp.]|nr:hypothetical protein [Anaerolinea sp.]
MIVSDDTLLPPRYVVENYKKAYLVINGKEPSIRYVGNQWYSVNGETVHRVTLLEEIARLRELSNKQSLQQTPKSVIQRLISRLKAL